MRILSANDRSRRVRWLTRSLTAVVVAGALAGCGSGAAEQEDRLEEHRRLLGAAVAIEDPAVRRTRVEELTRDLESTAQDDELSRQLAIETLSWLMGDAASTNEKAQADEFRRRRHRWLRRRFEERSDALSNRVALAQDLAETGADAEAWDLLEAAIPGVKDDLGAIVELYDGAQRLLATRRALGGEDTATRTRRLEKLLELTGAAISLTRSGAATPEQVSRAWADHGMLLFGLARYEEARAALARLREVDPGGQATATLERWLRGAPRNR